MTPQHTPCAQADGDPGVTKQDVATAICALVAAAKLAGVSCLCVLSVVADTWDADISVDVEAFRAAADRITG